MWSGNLCRLLGYPVLQNLWFRCMIFISSVDWRIFRIKCFPWEQIRNASFSEFQIMCLFFAKCDHDVFFNSLSSYALFSKWTDPQNSGFRHVLCLLSVQPSFLYLFICAKSKSKVIFKRKKSQLAIFQIEFLFIFMRKTEWAKMV